MPPAGGGQVRPRPAPGRPALRHDDRVRGWAAGRGRLPGGQRRRCRWRRCSPIAGCSQFHTAETEKYAHVTFFFNGGRETPFPGEDRLLVPSPKVATYDLKPEMSAPELTDEAVRRIQSGDYDFIIMNYANADMVGHYRRARGGDQGRRGGGRGRRARGRGGAGAGRRGADHRRPRQRRAADRVRHRQAADRRTPPIRCRSTSSCRSGQT